MNIEFGQFPKPKVVTVLPICKISSSSLHVFFASQASVAQPHRRAIEHKTTLLQIALNILTIEPLPIEIQRSQTILFRHSHLKCMWPTHSKMDCDNLFPPLGVFSKLPYELRAMIWEFLIPHFLSFGRISMRPDPEHVYELPPLLCCSKPLRDEISYYIEKDMELTISIHINHTLGPGVDRVCLRYDLWYKASLISPHEPCKQSSNTHLWKDLLTSLLKWKPHAALKICMGMPREYCLCHSRYRYYYRSDSGDELWPYEHECSSRLGYYTPKWKFNLIALSDIVNWIINKIAAVDSNPPNVRVSLLDCEQEWTGYGWVEDGKPASTFEPYRDYELILSLFLRLPKCEFNLPESLQKMISDESTQSEQSIFPGFQSALVQSGQWRCDESTYEREDLGDDVWTYGVWVPTEDNWWRIHVPCHDVDRAHQRLLDIRALYRQQAALNPTFAYNYRAFLNEDLSSLSIPVDFDGNVFYQTKKVFVVTPTCDGPPDHDDSSEEEEMEISDFEPLI